MITYQKEIGNRGERLAADYLNQQGYQLLDQKFTAPYGELDLVALESDMVVFVEVKTRTSESFGMPESGITPAKLERIEKAGLVWLQGHPEMPDDWRIDVIAIQIDQHNNILDLQHFINVSS